MKVNFDEIVERQGTYSAKWMGANGNSADYRNPDVRLPFQVADMDFACPEPLVQAMHRVADHRILDIPPERVHIRRRFLRGTAAVMAWS